MDFDPREDHRFGPMKLARTDALPLKIHLPSHAPLLHPSPSPSSASLVRCNSMASDCRLSTICSPTSSSTTSADGGAAALLLGADGMSQHGAGNYLEEARFCLNRGVDAAAMATYMGNMQRYGSGGGNAAAAAAAFPFRGAAAAAGCYMGSMLHDAGDPLSAAVFTAGQLRELQLHALIFKHLMCGVNVPPELALPIRTSVAAMTAGTAHHLAATFGWGGYAMGYGNSLDPEPGRCRRTDGKKWRCSRDVVPDQKYCERHMHRGRHRSRKPPEPQYPSNTSTATTTTTTTTTNNLNNNSSNLNNNNNNNSNLLHHQSFSGGNIHNNNNNGFSSSSSPSPSNSSVPSAITTTTTRSGGTATNSPSNSALARPPPHASSSSSSASSDLTCSNFSPHHHRYICADQELFSDGRRHGHESPALSSLSAITSAVNNHDAMQLRSGMQPMKQAAGAHSFLAAYDGRESTSTASEGQPLRHFFDDWPAGRGGRDGGGTATSAELASWAEVETATAASDSVPQPSRVAGMQLSISIPVVGEQLGSNGSSPRGKLALSPLKLSMSRRGGGGGGSEDGEDAAATEQCGGERPTSTWVPITWGGTEHSVGGPLAEVLHSSNNTPRGGTAASGVGAAGSSSSSSNNNHPHHNNNNHNNNNTNTISAASAALNLMAEGWPPDPHAASSPSTRAGSAHFHQSPPPTVPNNAILHSSASDLNPKP